MPCSICNKSGHNKVTCQRSSNDDPGTIPLTYAQAKVLELKVNNLKNKYVGKTLLEDKNCQLQKTPVCSKNFEDRKSKNTKLDEIKMTKRPCGVCGESTHDSKDCDIKSTYDDLVGNFYSEAKGFQLPEDRKNSEFEALFWENVKINDKDKDILSKKGLKRFRQGPSQDDGAGHIYMYKLHSQDIEEVEVMFKIGCCLQLPHRRVHIQEVRNKEMYEIVYTKEVAYRKLAELLIHLRLKDKGKHCHRLVNDGGTEWFKGKKDEFVNDINVILRFIHIYSPPTQN